MSMTLTELSENLKTRLGDAIVDSTLALGELTIVVPKEQLLEVCAVLRNEGAFDFAQLIDLCGVDYSEYGEGDWRQARFAIVYHLLSVQLNQRLRLKVF
ncbi:MAG: NADH-quinone oxidoreductase subunit C, partial [Halothiobacillaceae bacterium]